MERVYIINTAVNESLHFPLLFSFQASCRFVFFFYIGKELLTETFCTIIVMCFLWSHINIIDKCLALYNVYVISFNTYKCDHMRYALLPLVSFVWPGTLSRINFSLRCLWFVLAVTLKKRRLTPRSFHDRHWKCDVVWLLLIQKVCLLF